MKTITAEQAENEAARNWCASLLIEDGLSTKDTTAKRWLDIGVGILLGTHKDAEMSDAEKLKRCDEVYREACAANLTKSLTVCEVGGEKYALCTHCPLRVDEP